MWLTFNSSLSGVSALTNDITIPSKIWRQLLSLTPPLVRATTQTHLNDCHHFPASLPRKADSDICLSPLEGFPKVDSVPDPHLKPQLESRQTYPGIPDSSGPNASPHDPPISPLCFSHCSHPLAFPSHVSIPGVRSNPCPSLPKDATPAWREAVPVCFDRVCSMAPWELLSTKPCAWPLDLNHSPGSVTLPKSCCLPASFLQDRGQWLSWNLELVSLQTAFPGWQGYPGIMTLWA